MNIAFFCECYRPTRNGVVVSTDTFARHLKRLGHQVHIFAPQFPNYEPSDELNVHRFPSFALPHVKDYPVAFPLAPRVLHSFSWKKFDVIHAQSPWWLGRVGASLARLYNRPLVLTYHTLFSQYLHYIPLPRLLTKPLVLWLSRQFCNRCNLVIVPTEGIKSVLQEQGVATRIVALPTGVNIEEIEQGRAEFVQRKHGLPPNADVLLYVGRVGLEKSVDFLLYAVAKILRERKNVLLVIVGAGPFEEQARRIAREVGIGDKVLFVGSVPPEEVRHYLAAARLFVFASRTETQGIVLAEALAAGVPCVAVNAFGTSNVLTDGVDSFLVPPDVHTFTLAAETLLDDATLRRQFAENAKRNAPRFSAEASAKQLLDLYGEVIEEHRSRRGWLKWR